MLNFVFRRHSGDVQRCGRRRRTDHPWPSGRFEVWLTPAMGGIVQPRRAGHTPTQQRKTTAHWRGVMERDVFMRRIVTSGVFFAAAMLAGDSVPAGDQKTDSSAS